MIAAPRCWHCGEPLPADPPRALVAGVAHPVCCQGCRAVAEWIDELGLADYYRLRRASALRAPDRVDTASTARAVERPELARHFVRTLGDGRSEALVLVEGLRCAACCWLIERTLGRLPGVAEVGMNAQARRARILYDGTVVSLAGIVEAFARIGYRALPLDRAALDDARGRETRDAQKRLAVAGFGAMQAMMYASALWFGAFDGVDVATRDLFRWLTLLAATPVVLYSAAPFFAGARRLLAARRLGMDVPVALAVALIYASSVVEVAAGGPDVWFESVSMFVFFLCVGRYLEMRARHRAGELSDALARLTPAFADRLEADGSLRRVAALELLAGDRVVVADGGAVPADGDLESAQCRVDEALLCGESVPLTRRRGESLYAGSVVVGAPATLRVTRVGADTVVAGIVALTARAMSSRPRLAREGERAAAAFVARVLVLAAAAAIGWAIVDIDRAFAATVAVLVVACPCAFALAAPAAVTRALAVLTGRGVLVVRPDALEDLASVTHLLFDKTGTLTEPSIAQERTVALRHVDRDGALALAAALARGSRHPLARAFAAAAPAALPAVAARESVAGCGVAGAIGGRRYRLGRAGYALGRNDGPADLDDAIVLADDEGAIAAFHVDERIRPGARAAVDALGREGIRVGIASGDAKAKVSSVAASLGIADWAARESPADKLAWVESLRAAGARVAVVADGVNDAPMLAGADVAVAVGSAADAAQAASDIVVTGELGALADARALAREMLSILRQNRRWALGYNLAAVPLAALGFVPPWLAAIGMSASSLFVVLNALRIGRSARTSAGREREPVALDPRLDPAAQA
ncbi:MAG TPA: heavy metal translocating P-type ATPase metal-binding domain-containing protein [Casimicrobiaceae bacterium]|nr:heavy metal translocating P-type ATPase metal-binding domain-containing protein [Casimicrobiaceae bacterium]